MDKPNTGTSDKDSLGRWRIWQAKAEGKERMLFAGQSQRRLGCTEAVMIFIGQRHICCLGNSDREILFKFQEESRNLRAEV